MNRAETKGSAVGYSDIKKVTWYLAFLLEKGSQDYLVKSHLNYFFSFCVFGLKFEKSPFERDHFFPEKGHFRKLKSDNLMLTSKL